jgi:hypothetical protein
MGMGLWPGEGEWCRIEMGEEGEPQGVSMFKVATWSKCGRCLMPMGGMV